MNETLIPPAKKRFLARTVLENQRQLAALPPLDRSDTYDFGLNLNAIPQSIKALEQKDWAWFAEALWTLGYALYGRALYASRDPRALGWGDMWQIASHIYPDKPKIGNLVLVNDAMRGRRFSLGVGVLNSIDAEPMTWRRAKHEDDGGPLTQSPRYNLTLLDGRPMAWTNASLTPIVSARFYAVIREIAASRTR